MITMGGTGMLAEKQCSPFATCYGFLSQILHNTARTIVSSFDPDLVIATLQAGVRF